jgi:hypothetical protein
MPGRGNEKPDAESTVKAVQRRFATPVPRVADLAELNASLRRCCEAERRRVVQSLTGPFTIGDRLAEDLAAAGPLPPHRFDPCVTHPAAAVDKYQTVAYDTNRYSVPRPFAFGTVTVKAYVDQVVIVAGGQAIARHRRPTARHTMVLDPLHYLVTLGRRPGALDCAPVFRDWKLPGCFATLRAALERQHGAVAGGRRYARVLQLLAEHPLVRVREAIDACLASDRIGAEAVIREAQVLAATAATAAAATSSPDLTAMPGVHVPRPDLSRFDRLLGTSGASESSEDLLNQSRCESAPEAPVSVFLA